MDAYQTWVAEAVAAVKRFASSRQAFTTDELWRVLKAPPEPRAMGYVVRACVKDKTIRATGRWVQSTRESCHSRPIREWIGV